MSGSLKVKKQQSARPAQIPSVLKSLLVTSGSLLNTHDVERYIKSKCRSPNGGGAAERVEMLDCFAYVVQLKNHADAVSAVCTQNHTGSLNPVCSFLYDPHSRSVYSGHQTLNSSRPVDPTQTDRHDADSPQGYESQEPATVLVTGLYFDHVTAECIKVCFEGLAGGFSASSSSPVRSVQFLKHIGIAFVQFDRAYDANIVVLNEEVRLKTWYGDRTVSVFLVRSLPGHYVHTHTEDTNLTDDIPPGSNVGETASLSWQQNSLSGGLTDDVKDALRRFPSGQCTNRLGPSCKSFGTDGADVTRAFLSLMPSDADSYPAATLYANLVAGYNSASGFETSNSEPYHVSTLAYGHGSLSELVADGTWVPTVTEGIASPRQKPRETDTISCEVTPAEIPVIASTAVIPSAIQSLKTDFVGSLTDPLGVYFSTIPDASILASPPSAVRFRTAKPRARTVGSDTTVSNKSPTMSSAIIHDEISAIFSLDASGDSPAVSHREISVTFTPDTPDSARKIPDSSFQDASDRAPLTSPTPAYVEAAAGFSRDVLFEEFAESVTSSTDIGALATSVSSSADTVNGTSEISNSETPFEVPAMVSPASSEVTSSTSVTPGERPVMSADRPEVQEDHESVNPLVLAATDTVNNTCGCTNKKVNENSTNQSPDEHDSDSEQDVFYDCVEEMDSTLSREMGSNSAHGVGRNASGEFNRHFLSETVGTNASGETSRHSLQEVNRNFTEDANRHSSQFVDTNDSGATNRHSLQEVDKSASRETNGHSLQGTNRFSTLDTDGCAAHEMNCRSLPEQGSNAQTGLPEKEDCSRATPQTSSLTIAESLQPDRLSTPRLALIDDHAEAVQRSHGSSYDSDAGAIQGTIQRPWETDFKQMQDSLHSEMAQLKACMNSEISQLKTSVQSALANPQSELNSEIIKVKAQMATDIARLRVRMQSGVAGLQSSLQAQLDSCMAAAAQTQWSLQMQDRMQNRMLYEALQQTRSEIVTLKGETQELKMMMAVMQAQLMNRDNHDPPRNETHNGTESNLHVNNPSDTESVASMSLSP